MARKRPHSPTPPSSAATDAATIVTRSAPIADRGSTFIALYSPTVAPRTLQADPSLADAMHRILAWRVPSTQRTLATTSSQPPRRVYDTGHDEDGERYAGKKLATLLESMRVEGAVVVGRWFGGTLLGPVRFAHIEAVAREAIRKAVTGEASGASGAGGGGDRGIAETEEQTAKRAKVDEQALKAKLAEVLRRRDQSVEALRGMLAGKIAAAAEGADDGNPRERPTPKKPPLNYDAMPVGALQRLEKARDATIGWLLKEIEKAEKSTSLAEAQEQAEDGDEVPQIDVEDAAG